MKRRAAETQEHREAQGREIGVLGREKILSAEHSTIDVRLEIQDPKRLRNK